MSSMSGQVMGRAFRKKLHDAAGADANGEELVVFDPRVGSFVAGAFQISGTLTSVVLHFECTLDGTNWVDLECTPSDDNAAPVTTATAAGVWQFNALGLYKVRCRLDWTTGSVTVWGSLVA